MKKIAKLLAVGLLMQSGIAQASWIYKELLGAKQAEIVYKVKYPSCNPANTLQFALLDEDAFKEYEITKNEDAYNKATKSIAEKRAQVSRESRYANACVDASYLEERRDFIKPFGTFGLDCLSLPISRAEEKYKRFKTSLHPNLFVDTATCHQAILQFDLEQRIYQNRVVAGVVLGAVSIAGYLWANKK